MLLIKLNNLAEQINAKIYGDKNILIFGISSIKSAKQGHITFLTHKKYCNQLINCQASAVILTQENLQWWNKSALVVNDPYLAYAYIAKIFNNTPNPAKNISKNAIIDPTVKIGKNISIGDNAVIESGVELKDNVIVGAGCFIGKNTTIGTGTHLWANVTIYHKIKIGSYCLIHSGTVIGSDGFGYAKDLGKWIKIPQLGSVIIGNKVEIGACTTIDRGALDDTIIGNGVIIDNQCHIAHNVIIGDNTAIAAAVIMAGGLNIGSNCMIGGATVINGHIDICDKVTVTGMSMIIKTIKEPGIYSSGMPSRPNKIWRKNIALMMNIKNINKRLKNIEGKIRDNK